ncbi:hypothetical protein [Lactobacillus johnsonii]|uniref:hypothetical protein n=1 Tax=Lactobacillus johnsonii TaxID=33959 RepID=UPI00364B4FA0
MAKDIKEEGFDMFKHSFEEVIAWAEQSVKRSDEKRRKIVNKKFFLIDNFVEFFIKVATILVISAFVAC